MNTFEILFGGDRYLYLTRIFDDYWYRYRAGDCAHAAIAVAAVQTP